MSEATEDFAKYDHIPQAELEQDYRDTEADLEKFGREARAYELLTQSLAGDANYKINAFRARERRDREAEAKKLLAHIKAILDYRAAKQGAPAQGEQGQGDQVTP